jgi:Zn-dependent peptidase ImmA (M78 family)/DNA-binding XRE family transcriptional regulator
MIMDTMDNHAISRPFSSARLKVARQRRKMTMKTLAEKIRVNPMMMTRLEKGTYNPDNDLFLEISIALQMPYNFFYSDDCDILDISSVSFRSKRSMTAIIRDKILSTGSIASTNLSIEFNRQFKKIPLDLPDLSEYRDRPATAAHMLRYYWKLGVGPITNMIKLLEAKGVHVYWVSEDSSSADAVSFWRDDNAFVLMNSFVKSGERCRFNAAHELAHLVLHRKETVIDGFDIEREADTFASAFLLDRDQFYKECPRLLVLSNFFPLKKRWGVSIQAMIRRGKDLGVFREYQYERAYKEISIRGWRKSEPHEILCEESFLHRRIFENFWSRKILPSQFSETINLNCEIDLLEMVPIARDYLSQEHRDEYISRVSQNIAQSKSKIISLPNSNSLKTDLLLQSSK